MAQKARKASTRQQSSQARQATPYSKIGRIDGRHPLQSAVPEMCVMYEARQREGAQVAYFNFELAKEMGLIPQSHANELNKKLIDTLIDTFSLVIINEWDIENNKKFDPKTIKPNEYMATRYLQLQHDSKSGKTSGDGRSIWNGQVKHQGKVWDVSSCGTGGTCLSPAVAIHQKYFKTGDKGISYGCGLADFDDGLMASVMSEILHRKGIPTERTLLVLRYKDGTSINVRAAQNLLRPAHMFRYLKLGDDENLKKLVDFYIDQEKRNDLWPSTSHLSDYENFLNVICDDFAKSAALFEREYIFCWFDWDGDNILTSGAAILDYGSIRQFGAFHKEYRYDDVERWSTSILEQKGKARYIVQSFAQLVDFISTGEKRPIKDFANHPILTQFDKRFAEYKKLFLVKKTGLGSELSRKVLEKHPRLTRHFEKLYEHFERLQTQKGTYKVSDGVTSDAIFCMRDILRELPRLYLGRIAAIDEETFIEIAQSKFASKEDLECSYSRKRNIQSFQKAYMKLMEAAANLAGLPLERLYLEVSMRSSLVNRPDFLTGNGVISLAAFLAKAKKGELLHEVDQLLPEFINHQISGSLPTNKRGRKSIGPEMRKMIEIVRYHNEDI